MTKPIVKTQMLIRKPVTDVFAAFTDPVITTKFWFSKSSGKLGPDARVRWDWEMYGVHDNIAVKAFEPNSRVVYEWNAPKPNTVEWRFEPHAQGTMLHIINSDLKGEDAVAEALDLMEGWTLVIAAAKAWLEHGVALNLVADKAPDQNLPGWEGRA